MHFLQFLKEDWGAFQNVIYVKRGRKYLKNHIEKSHLRHSVIKKAFKWRWIKVRTSLTSTIEVLREEVELSNTRAYCFRYAHSQHTESHLGKKLPQAKIPITFLFSKPHFNNVTEMLSFYSGHLLIRSSTPNFLIESFGYGVLHSRKTDYKYEAESERPTSKKETTTNGKRTK